MMFSNCSTLSSRPRVVIEYSKGWSLGDGGAADLAGRDLDVLLAQRVDDVDGRQAAGLQRMGSSQIRMPKSLAPMMLTSLMPGMRPARP